MRATPDFHLHIQDICDDHKVKQHDIVEYGGYRKSSVSLVFTGERCEAAASTLNVLETLFEITGDSRVLLTGRRNVAVVELPQVAVKRANIQMLVSASKCSAKVMSTLADVFADGIVNSHDGPAVRQLAAAIDDAVKNLLSTKLSIERAYKDTTNTTNTTP